MKMRLKMRLQGENEVGQPLKRKAAEPRTTVRRTVMVKRKMAIKVGKQMLKEMTKKTKKKGKKRKMKGKST